MFSDESKEYYKRVIKDDLNTLKVDQIKSSGYVVESLEAAMWVLLKAKDYKETIIGAVNLGGDTDTIAAIAGSMAGIIYGIETFPNDWIDALAQKDYLVELATRFEKLIK